MVNWQAASQIFDEHGRPVQETFVYQVHNGKWCVYLLPRRRARLCLPVHAAGECQHMPPRGAWYPAAGFGATCLLASLLEECGTACLLASLPPCLLACGCTCLLTLARARARERERRERLAHRIARAQTHTDTGANTHAYATHTDTGAAHTWMSIPTHACPHMHADTCMPIDGRAHHELQEVCATRNAPHCKRSPVARSSGTSHAPSSVLLFRCSAVGVACTRVWSECGVSRKVLHATRVNEDCR